MYKRTLLSFLVCFFLLLSMTSCADTHTPVSNQESGPSNSYAEQNPNSFIEPPTEVRFESMDEIKAFFSEGNVDQESSSVEIAGKNIFQYAAQSEAAKLANTANMVQYPIADAEKGLSYHANGPDGPYLDIIYVVDGIQYSFSYFYDCHAPMNYEGEPDYPNVQIGPYAINLYRMDSNNPYLIGNTLINGFVSTVRIQGDGDMEKFDFSLFRFAPLSDVSDDEVA